MIDKSKYNLEEQMEKAYSIMRKCSKEKGYYSCSECKMYDQRNCFSYQFYWSHFELSQLIDDINSDEN